MTPSPNNGALHLALSERDADALFVINHSGGKDSQALLLHVLTLVPPTQVLVVHATLGEAEWPGALEHAQQQAQAAGVPFVVAQAIKTFFEMVEHRFRVRPGPNSPCWPSASNRQCTSDLKRGPIQREVRRYAKAHGILRIVSCMGIRAEESPRRAKAADWQLNGKQSVAGRTWHEWLPLHDWSADEVFATIARAGQTLHPAYGQGNERLSCVFCVMSSRSDLRNGAQRNPELYAKYVELERRTGYTMHMSRKSLPELTGIMPKGEAGTPLSPTEA